MANGDHDPGPLLVGAAAKAMSARSHRTLPETRAYGYGSANVSRQHSITETLEVLCEKDAGATADAEFALDLIALRESYFQSFQ